MESVKINAEMEDLNAPKEIDGKEVCSCRACQRCDELDVELMLWQEKKTKKIQDCQFKVMQSERYLQWIREENKDLENVQLKALKVKLEIEQAATDNERRMMVLEQLEAEKKARIARLNMEKMLAYVN